MKVKLRRGITHWKCLGNFLLAENRMFCDLKAMFPIALHRAVDHLHLLIDTLMLLSSFTSVVWGLVWMLAQNLISRHGSSQMLLPSRRDLHCR